MRIATWNVERPIPKQTVKNKARLEKIREINADIWILTESHEVIDLSPTHYGEAPKRHTVDQISMDVSLAEKVDSVGAWERERSDGLRLSDHSGIYVDLSN